MSVSGYAKSIATRLINKRIEVYQGAQHDTVKRAEIETARKTVICGILVEVLEECLIVEVVSEDSIADVYINTYNIHSILEVKDGMSIVDIYEPDERKQIK